MSKSSGTYTLSTLYFFFISFCSLLIYFSNSFFDLIRPRDSPFKYTLYKVLGDERILEKPVVKKIDSTRIKN